jgi:hypothetical protein
MPRVLPTRREFLWQSGGGLALACMLGRESALAQEGLPGGKLHAKAKRVVHFFMAGAASHIDLFDYKPELVKRDGLPSDFGETVEAFQNGLGPWLKPVWDFKPHGRCGKLLGEPVGALGKVVDEIAFVHNMVSKSGVHSTATLLQATGFLIPGFPGAGCSKTPSSSGPPNSAGCRRARAATTTPTVSLTGCAAAGSRAASATARATNGVTSPMTERTRPRSTTSTPRCYTCLAPYFCRIFGRYAIFI